MTKVGIVGLGNMGGGIALNLLRQGRDVVGFDMDRSRAERIVEQGGSRAESIAELGDQCDIVMLFLPMAPNHSALGQVVLGDGGLVSVMRRGACVLDCGNTSPLFTKLMAERLGDAGIDFMDVPISGGPQGAAAGTSTAMVGGDEIVVQKWAHVLDAIGARWERFGDIASGQMAKLCNNILVAANLATLSEVLIFAERNGIELDRLLGMISQSAGGSWVVDNYGSIIVNRKAREEGEGPRLEYSRDNQLFWATEIAEAQDIPLSMTSQAHKLFMMARGLSKRGSCEPIVEMLEDMTGADVTTARIRGQ